MINVVLVTETFALFLEVRKEGGIQSYALKMILMMINNHLGAVPVTRQHHSGEARSQVHVYLFSVSRRPSFNAPKGLQG